jgi:hypothetical protein
MTTGAVRWCSFLDAAIKLADPVVWERYVEPAVRAGKRMGEACTAHLEYLKTNDRERCREGQ